MARIPTDIYKAAMDRETQKDDRRFTLLNDIATNIANDMARKKLEQRQMSARYFDYATKAGLEPKGGALSHKQYGDVVSGRGDVNMVKPAMPAGMVAKQIIDPSTGLPKTTYVSEGEEVDKKTTEAYEKLNDTFTKLGWGKLHDIRLQAINAERKRVGLAEFTPMIPTGYKPASAGQTGAVDLATASPGDVKLARGVIDGTIDLSRGVGPRDRLKINELAYTIAQNENVPYNDMLGATRAKVRQAFTTGKEAMNVRSLNTLIGHIDELKNSVDELEPTQIPLLNKIVQYGKQESGDPAISKVLTSMNAVAGEAATLFKGTSGTDQEIEAWKEAIKMSQGKAQWKASIDTMLHLMNSRMSALQGQWDNAFEGTGVPLQLLSNDSKKTLGKYGYNFNETKEPPAGQGYSVGGIVEKGGKKWVIRSLKADGTPDDVEEAR